MCPVGFSLNERTMKSAVNKGGPTPILSHIPLPRRKSSSKSDKGLDVDSELGTDSVATKSQTKMSLLGGTSFCCVSGQKEDSLPPPRKRTPNAKQAAPNNPYAKDLSRSRRGRIVEKDWEDAISQSSETGLMKQSLDDIKIRPPDDSRLRPPDLRGRNTPSSPQRKISRDPLPFHKDTSEAKKSSEVVRKLRKDASPRAARKSRGNGTADNHLPKESCSALLPSGKVSPPKFTQNEMICSAFPLSRETLVDTPGHDACHPSGVLPTKDDGRESVVVSVLDGDLDAEKFGDEGLETADSEVTDSEVMKNSHDSDDFDCPCCDRTSALAEGPMSDAEIHVFTSCDVVATPSRDVKATSEGVSDKEETLQGETEALKEELRSERLRLKTHQDRLQHLQTMMEQLKKELEKEKELRKIAEDKFLDVLDHERRGSEKRMESKGTQKDSTDVDASENSPLVMGYESRVRRYQTYITKLEKDNLTLVNELKKFKELAFRPLRYQFFPSRGELVPFGGEGRVPLRRSHNEVPLSLQSAGSQEDQAKLLLEKLGEIQRNSHQQQLQYESCLDEVANRLVHTLLVQKRLEEECKVLHLRVEQLEQENGTLVELIDDDKNENMIRAVAEGEMKLESANSKVLNKLPSQYPTTSSSTKKDSSTREPFILSDERISEPLKVTTVCSSKSSEPKSPVSPKTGCTSKIPAFGSAKPAAIRKKSKTESQQAKTRNEIHPKEPTSPLTVPNIKSPSSIPSSRTKMPLHSDTTKGTSVKRKRLSRNGSPAEKGVKESKQRLKTNHTRWEQRGSVPEDLTSLCKSSKGNIQGLSRQQQVWSFSCEVDGEIALPESSRKIADSIDAFRGDGHKPSEEVEKQFLNSSEAPASVGGGNRTRDEGYSTMSSDLQPDSAADTNASEPEHSATYIATERELRCVSDDSVTECLDGSMCSSSDSGFGPLHQVANSRTAADLLEEESCGGPETFSSAQDVPHNISTVRHKEQIASVKPIVRNNPPPTQTQLTDRKNKPCIKPKAVCDNFINSEGGSYITQLKQSAEEFIQLSPLKSINILEKVDASLKSSSPPKPPKFRHTSMLGYRNYPKDILDVTSRGETWHLGPQKSCFDDQIVFCSRHSYIDDNIFDDKVETAEKATLTEPEEGHWREKALAPFIDESIWSLYSSEGDIRVKHFPFEPLLSESSLDKLITDCTPCIIVTEDVAQNDLTESLLCKTSNHSSDAGAENLKNGLERVASDTVLYLKDAIHELEDSMHRGLKSSKNIPALHNHSGSDSEASPPGLKPELLLNLESVTMGQSRLAWPSPTRSSSTSSLQSSTSIQVVSDEMEDVDLLRSSRKGSQDPDSSGASDVEGENLEHKDFVERWLQNEMASTASKMKVSQLEPVEEAAEPTPSCVRRTSLPLPVRPPGCPPRPRFKSYPQTSISLLNFRPDTEKRDVASLGPTCEPNPLAEDFEFRGVDSEVKEFNGDFYKLCSIGSLKSLDRFSPAKSQDAQKRWLSESPRTNGKTVDLANTPSNSEKPKPTGLVKPTRPVSLAVRYVPERFQSNRQCRENPKTVLESEQKAKHTPESHNAVFRKKNSPHLTSLPGSNAIDQTPKVKAATKIVFKSSASRRRQHSKKDERQNPLKEGCGTAWIHLQANPDLTDPMARISLLNSLKSPTSSSGSSSEEDEEEVLVIHTNSHLHRICRERRQKVKASANHPLFDGKKRSSIMGRHELFYRFGAKEKEAMACFDFLEELPTSSVETLHVANAPPALHRTATPPSDLCPAGREASSNKERISFLSPTASNKSAALANQSSTSQSPFSSGRRMRLPNLWNQPLSHNMSSSTLNSQDCELLDHISLSDSCAESYSSTPESSS